MSGLKHLKMLTINKDSYNIDALRNTITNLQSNGVDARTIVGFITAEDCSLKIILCTNDKNLFRAMFECEKWKKLSLEQRSQLIAFVMSNDYLDCETLKVNYKRGSALRKTVFLETIKDMLEGPKVDLNMARWFVTQLVNQNLIDKKLSSLFQRMFNSGTGEVVKMLLECGIDIEIKDKFKYDLKAHLFGNCNIAVSSMLQNRQFDLSAKGKAGFSALHFAVKKNLMENVESLLKAGADPNIKDQDGELPLFVAQSEKCIALLFEYGADIQSICNYGYTLFDMHFEMPKNVLIAQLVLMEARGSSIHQKIRDSVFRDDNLKDLYKKYTDELKWMKRQHIRKSLTLFAVLIEKIEVTARYVRDRNLISRLIDSCQNQQFYWYYIAMLEKNIDKAFSMQILKCKAAEVIAENITIFDYNNLITEKIVDFLTFNDLQLFV